MLANPLGGVVSPAVGQLVGQRLELGRLVAHDRPPRGLQLARGVRPRNGRRNLAQQTRPANQQARASHRLFLLGAL